MLKMKAKISISSAQHDEYTKGTGTNSRCDVTVDQQAVVVNGSDIVNNEGEFKDAKALRPQRAKKRPFRYL